MGAWGAFKTDFTTCINFWSPPPPEKSYTQNMLFEVFAHSNSTSIVKTDNHIFQLSIYSYAGRSLNIDQNIQIMYTLHIQFK